MWIADTIDLDDHEKVIDFLQGQSDRIKELEKREEQLLSEIEDFQNLLKQNDNVCYDRVIDLINHRIEICEKGMENVKHPDLAYTSSVVKVALEDLKKNIMED